MNRFRHRTINLDNYGHPTNPEPDRWAAMWNLIVGQKADLISVQEVMGEQPSSTFRRLAVDLDRFRARLPHEEAL